MKLLEECWKDIPGYEGFYQAHINGEIRSLDMMMPHPNAKTGYVKKAGRVLKKSLLGEQRSAHVVLYRLGDKEYFPVNYLVYITHVAPIPKTLHVHSKNGNALNNDANNLYVSSSRKNKLLTP